MAERLSEILALSPGSAAKSSRASVAGAAGTLQSVPGPLGVDPKVTGSSSRESHSSPPRAPTATAVLAETRIPQSGSTRPLTTPIPPAAARWTFVEQLRGGRRRLWLAAPVSVLCIALALLLRARASESDDGGRWPAAGSLSPAPGDAPAPAARDERFGNASSSLAAADAVGKRAAPELTAEASAPTERRLEPAAEVPPEPSPEASDELAIDIESMDADAIEPVAPPIKRLEAAPASKGRGGRHSSRRASKTRKKSLTSDSVATPSAASPAGSDADPFAERR
jgi:hypothetical protein